MFIEEHRFWVPPYFTSCAQRLILGWFARSVVNGSTNPFYRVALRVCSKQQTAYFIEFRSIFFSWVFSESSSDASRHHRIGLSVEDRQTLPNIFHYIRNQMTSTYWTVCWGQTNTSQYISLYKKSNDINVLDCLLRQTNTSQYISLYNK